MTGNHHKRNTTKKKNVAHFSALQIAHKSSGREKGRQRKRQSKSTRAFLTSLFRKNRTKSTSRKKNKHNKEEESSREGRTSRKIQKKNEKNTASLSTTRHASRRVGSAEVSAQVRGRATALLAFHCFQRFDSDSFSTRDACAVAAVTAIATAPALVLEATTPCRHSGRATVPLGRGAASRARPGRAIAEYFVNQNSCSFSAAEWRW